MAEITFSKEEESRIEEVLAELDPASHELMRDHAGYLAPEEWELLREYTLERIRRLLELRLALSATAEPAEASGLAHCGRGTRSFLRAAQAAWADAFSPVPEVWRIAPVFARVEAMRDIRIADDLLTLETIAVNRMFGCLDDEWAELAAREGR